MQDDNIVTQPKEGVPHFNESFTNMGLHIGPDDSVNHNDDVSCALKHECHDRIQNIRKMKEATHIIDNLCFHNIHVDTVAFTEIKL